MVARREQLVSFIAAWEAFRGKAYRATKDEKHLTIGFGHCSADVYEGQEITESEAFALLNSDLDGAVSAVLAVAHPSLTERELLAVCDLVFNAGPGVISAATGTGRALRDGDSVALRQKLGSFIYQNGKPMLGLRRRALARQCFFDGDDWDVAVDKGRALMT